MIGGKFAFLEGNVVAHSPWGLSASADSADTADDLLVDLKVEWVAREVRVLDGPGEAISENSGEVVVGTEAVLALNLGVGKGSARGGDVP